MPTTLTWLGHAAFRVDTPGGKRIYVDPFLNGNPKCPENEKEPERVDGIFITHGHNDHVGDTLELAKKFNCPVVAPVELRDYLSMLGCEADGAHDPNKGGTVEVAGLEVTLVHAQHSSSYMTDAPEGSATQWEIVYTGEPCGLVFDFGPDGDGRAPKLYFAGDTNVFGDMALIARLYAPDVAILPIGGHFTMDPKEAAVACELLDVKRCVPCHYGTFPILAGTPGELRELAPGVEVIELEPGGSIEL
jgi:L-ascorbate metabolism protein UlaG (beta-lactamase superfamily)